MRDGSHVVGSNRTASKAAKKTPQEAGVRLEAEGASRTEDGHHRRFEPSRRGPLTAEIDGFNLQAAVRIEATDDVVPRPPDSNARAARAACAAPSAAQPRPSGCNRKPAGVGADGGSVDTRGSVPRLSLRGDGSTPRGHEADPKKWAAPGDRGASQCAASS